MVGGGWGGWGRVGEVWGRDGGRVGWFGGGERERDLVEEKRQEQLKQKEDKRVNQLLTVKGWYCEQDGGFVGKELALNGCSVRGRV